MCFNNSSASLVGVSFSGNSAAAGGGIACGEASATLSNCILSGNTADGHGGGVYASESPLVLTSVVFMANTGSSGGGLYTEMASPLDMSCCTFWGNDAGSDGGGMAGAFGGPATLSNCTFYGNSAGLDGSAIFCIYDYRLTLDNTILAFNTGAQVLVCANRASAIASCCDVYGNDGIDWEACLHDQLGIRGNISECPLFCDPESGDFSLQECSPCAPGNHPDGYPCGLIGALDVGCSCGEPSAAEENSWSSLKERFR